MRQRPLSRGFTLIELLVVIAIIGILSAIVLAALNTARLNAVFAAGKQQDSSIYHAFAADATAIWNFDEGSGSSLSDQSGNGNSGTYSGATWSSSTPYNSGYSLVFNNGTCANFPNVQHLSSSQVTVTAWVNITTHRNWANLVNNNWIGNGWLLYDDVNGHPIFGVGVGGTQYNASASTYFLTTNTWHLLVGVYDGSNVQLYVDGAKMASVALSSATLTSSGTVTVGCGTIGAIDNVRIYPSPLTAVDIHKLYAAGPSAPYLAQVN